MKFKDIPAGSFVMGTQTQSTADCPKDNPFTKNNEYNDCVSSKTGSVSKSETPAHSVNVASFYMSETEVTQGQWYEVMGSNPAEFQNGNPDMPVETVSWDDAKNFIKKLNPKEGGRQIPPSNRRGVGVRCSCRNNHKMVLRRQ